MAFIEGCPHVRGGLFCQGSIVSVVRLAGKITNRMAGPKVSFI